MPFSYTCPYCGKQTFVDDYYAGQTGPCSGCGQMVVMPGTPDPNAPGPVAPGPVAPAYRPVARKGMGGGSIVLISVAVCFVVLACLSVLAFLLLPAVQAAREAARRMQCTNQLKQIELAMHNYADEYKQFPPAYTVDESGKPLHSWRTLLLPYMEQQAIYNLLKLDEPWDSPYNLSVFEKLHLAEYSCPSSQESQAENFTNYVMVVGPGCVSDGPTGCKLSDLVNGLSNTIHVVETTAPIPWYEPRDLALETVLETHGGDKPVLGGNHYSGFNATLCDASVQFLRDDTPLATLKAMLEGRVKNSVESTDFDSNEY